MKEMKPAGEKEMSFSSYVWNMWLCGLAYMLAGVAIILALPGIALIHVASAIGDVSDYLGEQSGRFDIDA